jgi:phage anti-repressor protein
MIKLRIIENQLIPIYENNQKQHLVNARELHEFIESKRQFADWIKDRIEKYGFVENTDYTLVSQNYETSTGGTVRKDYILKIDTAKEIAMVENNDKGKQIRRYFIELENRFNVYANLSPQLQMFKQIFDNVVAQELELKQVKSDIANIKENVVKEYKDDWREQTNNVITAIAKIEGNFREFRQKLYKELDRRAGTDIKRRLQNLKDRAEEKGMSKTQIEKLNYLDVIEDDKKLKEIFIAIIKEYAVKYGVDIN